MDFNLKLLSSATQIKEAQHTINYVLDWVSQKNREVRVDINKISFDKLKGWHFSETTANLKHQSGQFFSIDGISVSTNNGAVSQWQQPIINQPEIGYLGFICKEINGVLHFLTQAKIEPGNVNFVQLSPTLQATKSNYTQVHKGKVPAYLNYFKNAKPSQIVVDQLQSEQGARFLKKRNRNIIIIIDEEIALLPNFIWLTLAQLKMLMLHDNLVNMDTRTVLSCIQYHGNPNQNDQPFLHSFFSKKGSYHSLTNLIKYITARKCHYELEVEKTSLFSLQDWQITDTKIFHKDLKYFSVIPVEVTIDNREVATWCQPMIEPAQEGLCAFICKSINEVLHFIVQLKIESGNFDILELAPTVQCLTGNYKTEPGSHHLPFLKDVLTALPEQILFSTIQSEEGGRFYKEQNRNMLIKASDNLDETLPENYIWMTLNQIQIFIQFNNYFNIQARSIIAAMRFDE